MGPTVAGTHGSHGFIAEKDTRCWCTHFPGWILQVIKRGFEQKSDLQAQVYLSFSHEGATNAGRSHIILVDDFVGAFLFAHPNNRSI